LKFFKKSKKKEYCVADLNKVKAMDPIGHGHVNAGGIYR